MSKIKYAMAVVAAGGAAATASVADAAVVTDNFGYSPTTAMQPVNLAGASKADPQYLYGESGSFKGLTPNGTALIGEDSTTPGLPSASESFSSGPYTTSFLGPINPVDNYLHLKFTEGGQTYLGYATISGASATLESVTYAAVPEPEAWALLISGLGMTGAAMRRQRRLAPQTA